MGSEEKIKRRSAMGDTFDSGECFRESPPGPEETKPAKMSDKFGGIHNLAYLGFILFAFIIILVLIMFRYDIKFDVKINIF